jgi:small subunit ribosomal protein S2
LVSRSQGGVEQAAAEPMPDWERELLGAGDEVPQTAAAPAESAPDVEEIGAVAPLGAADDNQVSEDEAAVPAEEPSEVAAAEDAPTQTSTN